MASLFFVLQLPQILGRAIATTNKNNNILSHH